MLFGFVLGIMSFIWIVGMMSSAARGSDPHLSDWLVAHFAAVVAFTFMIVGLLETP
jgi:hypothetical protein